MTPLSILHVDPERGFSGGETQVMALAVQLRAAGHRSVIACFAAGPLEVRARAAGFEVVALACARSHDPVAGFRLRRLARALRPDVVHLHTARALSLAPYLPRDERAVRVVTRRMDYPPRGARVYVRWLYAQADAVIAISGAARAALVARGVPERTIAIVPSGVEVEHFADRGPAAARAARGALGVGPHDAVIAAVGSLHERKGHAVLLGALARLATRGLGPLALIAGAGPEGDRLLELAARLGVAGRVRWLGRVDDVRAVLLAADVVAMPSLAEGLGVAAIEAMAAARALVASEVGGLGELVRDGVEGLLVPPGDERVLAGALARCLEDDELRARLAAAGPARAAEFSAAAMARGTEAVYERALEERRRR